MNLDRERKLLNALNHLLQYLIAEYDACDVFVMSNEDHRAMIEELRRAKTNLEDKFIYNEGL